MAKRERKKFTADQKAAAVRLVRETDTISHITRSLDLTKSAHHSDTRNSDIDASVQPAGCTGGGEVAVRMARAGARR